MNRADAEAGSPRVDAEAGSSRVDAEAGSAASDGGLDADARVNTSDTGSDAASDARDGSAGDVTSDGAVAPGADGGDSARTGHTIYALDDMGQLLRFNSADPATLTKTALSGVLTGESIHGIDFRPSNGVLYALGSSGAVYTVAVPAGVATRLPAADAGVGTFPLVLDPTATSFGFDFNPAADRIRVHSNTGKNYRLHPDNGQSVNAAGDPDLFLATDGGTPEAGLLSDGGSAVSIAGTAYINSVPGATATKLYGIDSVTDQLVTFAVAPGFAEVSNVGPLGVDSDLNVGFDIYGGVSGSVDGGAPIVNIPVEAYASLRVGTSTGLFTVNLATGAATLVGTIAHDRPVRGLAVQP